MQVMYCIDCIYQDTRDMDPNDLMNNTIGYFDLRHKVFSVNNSNSIVAYLNYIQLCKSIVRNNKDVKNNHLLKLGYIPVCMPPTFMPWITQFIVPKLPIPYIERPACSFNNFTYVGDVNDIWIHKLDCAEYFNCKPEEITVRKVLKEIL